MRAVQTVVGVSIAWLVNVKLFPYPATKGSLSAWLLQRRERRSTLRAEAEKCGAGRRFGVEDRKRGWGRMRIQGLQKLTLLDYPGRTACTVFCLAATSAARSAITRRCSPQRTKTAWTKTSCWRFEKTAGASRQCCRYRRRAALRQASRSAGKDQGAGLCDQAGHERRVSGAAGGSCACRAGRLCCHGRQKQPVRYAQTVGAVELDLTPIDKSVSFFCCATP